MRSWCSTAPAGAVRPPLAVPPNVTLVPLPPCSLQLNPIERVWFYLRERFMSLRLFGTADDIVDA